ncbi:MAG TPA: amylo-alpha-1,6-glucosidase [Chloroflexia bacterium]|nr:amylo-alpha-1,6-glucosidase [Chloroflexia bacterium]
MSDPWASGMNKLVLREGDMFMVSDQRGDMAPGQTLGLYYNDTRYLSVFELALSGQAPTLLSSSCEQDFMANLQFTNPTLPRPAAPDVLPHTISLRRNRLVQDGLRERIGLMNYNREPVTVQLTLVLGADFRDMFDVRGFPRAARGTLHAPEWQDNVLTFSYTGLDTRRRCTRLSFDPPPTHVEILAPGEAILDRPGTVLPESVERTQTHTVLPPLARIGWEVTLVATQPWAVTLLIAPEGPPLPAPSPQFDEDARRLRQQYLQWETGWEARTDHTLFNRLLNRSLADLRVLSRPVHGGYLPVAGIPWFAVPFGRDSLITALQTLIFKPEIAVGTLHFLAAHQGQVVDPWREEQPGKILHEMRFGEMAGLGEIPHRRYYGTIDATPLFLLLFAETMRWLDDNRLFRELEPPVRAALDWIDHYGDLDGDGYVEHLGGAGTMASLRNQGWKDSKDSLQWPDGSYPDPPIALAEVQGYVYAAKQGCSALFARYGDRPLADRLAQEAAALKTRFNQDFWIEPLGFFAHALDGQKRPVPTVTSNPGHCLLAGLIDDAHQAAVVQRLLSPDMECGWGIRTVSSAHPSFNPMSYHNGSIWPHDNAIIAAGLMRHGYTAEALQILQVIMDAALHFRYLRLPELYCGFPRDLRYYNIPAEYPVSCSPQAWAAGTMVHLFQTMLGLEPDAAAGRLRLNPHFPAGLNEVHIQNLRLGAHTLDLRISRPTAAAPPTVQVLRNPGGLGIIVP